jgi:hypothetical protein
MRVNRLRNLAATLLVLGVLAPFAAAAPISVINGDHDVINGTLAGHVGLNGLGHTSTLYADTAGGWGAALAKTDTIVVEQEAAGGSSHAAVAAWVSAGNRLIILGSYDFGFGENVALLNGVLGTTMSTESAGADLEPFAKTAAAAGTTFADDAATLFGLSSHHEVVSGFPGGLTTYYAGAGDPIVFRATLGSGDVFWVGWDYCCGGTDAQANDWYGVLDSAIAFSSVPEPGMMSMALAGLVFGGFLVRRRRRNG